MSDTYGLGQTEGVKNYSTANKSDLPYDDDYYGLSQ